MRKCPQCGTLYYDDNVKICSKCYSDLPEPDVNTTTPTSGSANISQPVNQPTNFVKEHSKIFKIASIITIILGFIGGIIAGCVFRIMDVSSTLYTVSYYFNWFLMIVVWVTFGILAFIFWGIKCILKNIETIMS